MKPRYLPIGVFVFAIIIIVFVSGCTQRFSNNCPDLKPGEWYPQKGECNNPEMQQKCDEFCSKHPDCCSGWSEGRYNVSGQGGALQPFPLPDKNEITSLTRNYTTIIKAINEGPAIYSQKGPSGNEIMSDATIEKMKETGFNTVQILMIDTQEGDKFVADPYSKSVLLNDIVKIKKHGMAVWVALEYVNAPPGSGAKMSPYNEFEPAFLDFCREVGTLFEEYKVEYLTVNNEPDMFFREQTQWGTEDQINQKAAEFIPLANKAARETFNGKIINKATLFSKMTSPLKGAYFSDVDIPSIDVGPQPGGMTMEEYRSWFNNYQLFAAATKDKNLTWMVGEYWQFNYFENASSYVEQNQLKLAQVSFDAYLNTTPKGVGYTWNDFSSFSLQPNGEATRQAIKNFFSQMN